MIKYFKNVNDLYGQVGDVETFVFQCSTGVQHTFVFNLRSNDVAFLASTNVQHDLQLHNTYTCVKKTLHYVKIPVTQNKQPKAQIVLFLFFYLSTAKKDAM